MATALQSTADSIPRGGRSRARLTAVLSDYWMLTKPEVNFLIVLTTLAGFYLVSSPRPWRILLLFNTLLGTLLVASGTGTLNQYIERNFDSLMRRTSRRPLPAGRIVHVHALWFGLGLSIAGGLWLAVFVNLIASLIALLTLGTYLLFYTPMKRRTPLCTLVGAFPGAAPPLIGCAAATGRITSEAWLLYSILFLWQFPHFMAIAWMYREDYARAGYLTLPRGQQRTPFMVWQTLIFSSALVPITLVPSFLKQAGLAYFVAVLLLSSGFLYYSARFAISKSNQAARQLLFASIVYLPVVLGLIVGLKNG